jgi:hypothetical protein
LAIPAGNGILTIACGTLPLALFRPAAFVLESFGASVLLGVMCGLLLLCFIATWRLPITQKANNDDVPVDAASI